MLQEIFAQSLTNDRGVTEDLGYIWFQQDNICPTPRPLIIFATDSAGEIGLRDIVFIYSFRFVAHIADVLCL